MKNKTVYFCQSCGYESAKWVGRCPSCQAWNSFAEEIVSTKKQAVARTSDSLPKTFQQITAAKEERIITGDDEFNRVLGGGIVTGSLVLIGGEPGIGKSTLMLQIALQLTSKQILYVSGEESEQQIKMRAERIYEKTLPEHVLIYTETEMQAILHQAKSMQPDVIVIDSIQTLFSTELESSAGSVGQIRQCAADLMQFAKSTNTPVFLIGHITKDGNIAGPKVLEHMVDAVLQFEGDRHLNYRMLRTNKNRFGSTSELGIYEMMQDGLRGVKNPSEILISQKDGLLSGNVIAASMEGNRPLLVEIQALVATTSFGMPQRTTTGFDQKRMNLLIAVLEKRCGIRLSQQDIFVNMAGGIRMEDPAIDLAVCMAIFSSFSEKPISDKCCFSAEVGLGGELRAVSRIEARMKEATKLGFEKMIVSKFNQKNFTPPKELEILYLSKIQDVLKLIL